MSTRHPAKFSPEILAILADEVRGFAATFDGAPISVLDPFAGTGRIHQIADETVETVGVEIEPEWATMHPRTIVGNALHLPFPDASFDAIVTSPCYGNRMADKHEPHERCKTCGGTGKVRNQYRHLRTCLKCKGEGRNTYRRNTYRHALDRPLHEKNSGAMQWGDAYRSFHEQAWAEAARVLCRRGLFVLNISDHIRAGHVVPVTDWHVQTLEKLGFVRLRTIDVHTRRNRHGANRELRVDAEHVVVFVAF